MTSDNPVADRLVSDARGKTERSQSPVLTMVALVVGVVAVVTAALIPLAGWLLGAIPIAIGIPVMQGGTAAKQARVAVLLGVAAILIGVFFFTLKIA